MLETKDSVKPQSPTHSVQHEGRVVGSVRGYDVIDCKHCGFKHAHPIPDEETLRTLYERHYFSQVQRFPAEISESEIAFNKEKFTQRLEITESILPPHTRTLLDIGSGGGGFVHLAQYRGWHPTAVEPSEQGAARIQRMEIPVVKAFFNEKSARGLGTYDMVHLNCVLEHLPDPAATLSLAMKHLKPGGLLCIFVPNDFNPFQIAAHRALGNPQWWIAPNEHINYFNPESLKSLLLRFNLEITTLETTFPIDIFLLMGDNYVKDPSLGKACYTRRVQFDENLKKAGMENWKKEFYQAMTKLGIGREILAIARKVV